MNASGVSVIIPTRNRAAFLAQALESILAQTVVPGEIIVVDDGSTDGTAALVRDFTAPVRCLHQPARGPAAARNLGLESASGAYIAFLDDDDLWPADKTESQLALLTARPELGMVLGLTQRMVHRSGAEGGGRFVAYGRPVKLKSLGCGLFRRELFVTVGRFNPHMRFAEEDDWFMRAAELGIAPVFLPQVGQFYRFHDDNMTRDRGSKQMSLLRLAKNRLDRARARTGAGR